MPKFKLIIQDDAVSIERTQTRFGGLPAVPAGAAIKWPSCRQCKQAMSYIGQLRVERPAALLSLFICQQDCDSFDPAEGASAVLVFPPTDLATMRAPAKWKGKREREYGVRLETVEATDYFEACQGWDEGSGCHAVGQQGAKPAWLQSPEVPRCGECKKPMKFVAQLVTGGAFEAKSMEFGGDGDAYVFRCTCGRGSAKLCWQCY